MSVTLFHNCRLERPLVDEPIQEHAWILAEHGRIKRLGRGPLPGADRTVDLSGRRVLPGLVNAHTHLYSALAPRMPWPAPPKDFRRMLEQVWWRLDRALDAEAIMLSAQVGLVEAIRSGCTTVIDHHSSPNAAEGSLELIAMAAERLGVKIALSIEVSDRNGPEAFEDAMDENLHAMTQRRSHETVRAIFGLHAAFTLSDESLESCVEVLPMEAPFHLHCAEAEADLKDARRHGYESVVDRLAFNGVLRPGCILAHGVHLTEGDQALIAEMGGYIVHCPHSNAHNGVGAADVGAMLAQHVKVGLGTDGWLHGPLREARAARETGVAKGTLTPKQVGELLWEGNAALATSIFGRPVGEIEEGADADFIAVDGEGGWLDSEVKIARVVSRGELICEDGRVRGVDHDKLDADAAAGAAALWKRIERL
jgi:cytosine/adenosine deaminase-related metal-dependent hydrolase